MCSFGEHKGHDCILLSDYSDKIKGEIIKEAKELELRAKTLQGASQTIQKEMNEIKSVHPFICILINSFRIIQNLILNLKNYVKS